ncbi:hypothetical protein, partial [Thermodesulfatator autotrophicus]|uniref:hypothetical protein n=1 Tax=Thermodesulfatator autotrophicus TaxID=1795632 RepID=UPI0012FA4AD6
MSHETEKTRETAKEKTLQQKESKERRKTEGERRTEGKSQGRRISKEEARKRVLSMESGVSGVIELGLQEIFLPLIAERERKGLGLWGRCQVAEHPKLWAEFGVSYFSDGMLDRTGLEYFQQAARTRANIADSLGFDVERKIKSYVGCLVWYGAVIGAAGERLLAAIGEIGAGKKVGDVVNVTDLGLEDLYVLADEALRRTEEKARKALSGAEADILRTRYGREIARLSMLEGVRCAFAGDVNR